MPTKLSLKDRRMFARMLGNNADRILSALSSSYCEADDKEFKGDFGISIKEMTKVVENVINYFNN